MFVLPIFYPFTIDNSQDQMMLLGMVTALAVYYFGWYRYFANQREFSLLFSPLWILPLPLAVSPIVYFLSAGFIQDSVPLIVAATTLAIGHIPISYNTMKAIKEV